MFPNTTTLYDSTIPQVIYFGQVLLVIVQKFRIRIQAQVFKALHLPRLNCLLSYKTLAIHLQNKEIKNQPCYDTSLQDDTVTV